MTAIKVPPLGESIVEATVSRWLKKEGDIIAPGETLVELETDKITVEVPAMSGGVLTKRAHAEGDIVKVDDLLAEIDESATGDGRRAKPRRQPHLPPRRRKRRSRRLQLRPHSRVTFEPHQPLSALRLRRALISVPFRARVAAVSSANPM